MPLSGFTSADFRDVQEHPTDVQYSALYARLDLVGNKDKEYAVIKEYVDVSSANHPVISIYFLEALIGVCAQESSSYRCTDFDLRRRRLGLSWAPTFLGTLL